MAEIIFFTKVYYNLEVLNLAFAFLIYECLNHDSLVNFSVDENANMNCF